MTYHDRKNLFKNAGLVAGGTILAQCLNFAGYVASAQFLTPSQFGVFAAQLAVSTPLAIIATGRYETAFLRANSDARVINLLALCTAGSLAISMAAALVVGSVSASVDLLKMLDAQTIFLLVLGQSLLLSFTQLSNYTRAYGTIGKSRIFGALVTQSTILTLATSGFGSASLSYGFALGVIGSVVFMLIGNRKWIVENVHFFSFKRARSVAHRYFDLALFNAPQAIASALQDSLTVMFITSNFGLVGAGLYSLNNRLLRAPIAIIAESIGRVAQRHLSEIISSKKKSANAEGTKFLNELVCLAVLLGIIMFSISWVVGPPLASIAFSNEWSSLGEVVRASSPYFGFYLAGSTIVAIPVAIGANYRALSMIGVIGSAIYIASFAVSKYISTDLVDAFYFVSIVMAAYFSFLIIYIYIISRRRIDAIE